MGRPKRPYLEEYGPMLIEHMEKGLSFESFAGVLRTGKEQIYNWLKSEEDFANAKKVGDMLCMLFWEKLGIAGTIGDKKIKSFNTGTWIFNMKNRFGWSEKKETTIKGEAISVNFTRSEEKE